MSTLVSPKEPAAPSQQDESTTEYRDDELTLSDVLSFVIHSWPFTVGLALVGGGTVVALGLCQPRKWQSSSLLLTSSAEHSALFSPLTVQAYQRIFEAGDLVQRVRQRAAEKHHLDAQQLNELLIGSSLSASVTTGKRDDSVVSPIIELRVIAPDAAIAADLANYWADTGTEAVSTLLKTAYLPQVERMEQAYLQSVAKFRQRKDEIETAITRWHDSALGSTPGETARRELIPSSGNTGLTEFVGFFNPDLIAAKSAITSLEPVYTTAMQTRLQLSQSPIAVVSRAVEAPLPQSRNLMQKGLAASFAGAALGLFLAICRRLLRKPIS